MEIRIEEVGESSSVRFSSPSVSGYAAFVPYRSKIPPQVGDTFAAETAQESVSAFRVEGPQDPKGITALPTPGEYMVVAVVVDCWEDWRLAVVVDDWSFMLDLTDIDTPIPRKGDAVSFVVHGLSLYDTGI